MSIIALPLTSLIHPQILYERVNTQMVDRSRQSPEESPLSAIGTIQPYSNNEKFEEQGCHPFYKSVLEDALKNKVLSTSANHLYLVAIFKTWLYVHV